MTRFFHPLAALAALFLGAALAAQQTQPNPCPRVSALHVPASHVAGPVTPCGSGIRIQVAGITYSSEVRGCPIYVVFYPPHEVPQASGSDTWTFEHAKAEAIVFRLQCEDTRIIIIPIGSSCVHVDKFTAGTYVRLATVPCVKRE